VGGDETGLRCLETRPAQRFEVGGPRRLPRLHIVDRDDSLEAGGEIAESLLGTLAAPVRDDPRSDAGVLEQFECLGRVVVRAKLFLENAKRLEVCRSPERLEDDHLRGLPRGAR
jgi:hypothetical protein